MHATNKPQTIEETRTMLRRVWHKNPKDRRATLFLQRTIQHKYILQAAQKGVYICYSQLDELPAFEIATALQNDGINAWLDIVDIPATADWEIEVDRALYRSGVMLLLVSHSSIGDEQTMNEFAKFYQAGKIIIPLLIDDHDYQHLKILIPSIDMTDLDTGLAQLKSILRRPATV